MAQDTFIQTGWVIGYGLYTLGMAFMVFFFPPEYLPDIPLHWASDNPFSASAMRLTVVGFAVVGAGAAVIMNYGSVADWVLFVSFGRLALWYFFDWIIILTIMTAPDQDP